MILYRYQPVFIIGAARSGTRLLRDVIGQSQAFDCVPYDINYIWRLGNENCPHDELTPKQLSPIIAKRIISKVSTFSKNAPYLIEKTVSNSLRVPFVDALFPDAKYILLIRDGRDVVESAYRQWIARPDWKYLLAKSRSYPVFDAPGYAITYGFSIIRKLIFGGSNHVPAWGPRYDGIDQHIKNKSLLEVCAFQWVRSVENALTALRNLKTGRVITVRYEDFVNNPIKILGGLSEFLGLPLPNNPEYNITTANIGKRSRLNSKEQEKIYPILENTLRLIGYK